jgi:putative transposase
MLKAYKYRIYPNSAQKTLIDKTFGVCRFVYNLALETKIRAWESAKINLSSYDLSKQLTELRKEVPWMQEADRNTVNTYLNNMDAAYAGFFKGRGYPKFKKKTGRQTFVCQKGGRKVDFNASTITVPKVKGIKAVLSRTFQGEIRSISVSRNSSGKYYASVLVDCVALCIAVKLPTNESTVGLDMGLKSFVVASDGRTFKPNRHLRNSLQRLKCLQARFAKKKKGGSNRKKFHRRVALLHDKINNQRADYIHKITTQLVRDNQSNTFVVENLNVGGMLKNRCLSLSISDAAFGEFFRQMSYKCAWYGKGLIQIGRFDPSSKTCSSCGHIKDDLTLSDRDWTCKSCGIVHDRDLNAAINIKNFGLEQYSRRDAPGEPVESRRLSRAKKQEGGYSAMSNSPGRE